MFSTSLDAFPKALRRQLLSGTPRRWLLRRFYLAGRRDGKYIRESEPVAAYLRWGVSLVQTRLLEDLYRQLEGPRAQLALAKERTRLLESKADGIAAQLPSAEHQTGISPEMEVLLRGRHRHLLEAISMDEGGVLGIEASIQTAERICGQRVFASQESGSLLWSRYRTGYVHGLVARREDPRLAPGDELTFSWPSELARPEAVVADEELSLIHI